MAQYIFMGIILLLMGFGMRFAYLHGKYVERKRVIKELAETGVDFDGDTISTILLAQIVFDSSRTTGSRSK